MRQILAAGLLGLTLAGAARAQKVPEAIPLPVENVAEIEDFQTREYPGKIVAVALVNLMTRVSGEILEVGFKNGDIVKTGQLLYRLDSVKYEAAVKNAEAKIAEYKARTAYAESNYQRNKQLSQSEAVSKDALENVLSARNAYRANLTAAEADLESARDDLAHCRILAPIGGKVGTTNFTQGNYVTTASGTLVTLIQTSPIRVRFSISNRDFLVMFGGRSRNITASGTVKLILADGKEFAEAGRIEYVDNAADDNTDTIQVFAIFTNSLRVLKPGGTVGVTLQSRVGVKTPAVPPSAIMQDAKGAYVWVVDSGDIVRKRSIVRGDIAGNLQLVQSGLKSGDRIVTDGTHKVSAGDRIRPVKDRR